MNFDNGYCGGSRPQHTSFNTNDYYDNNEWNELTEEEKQKIIEQEVQQDYNNKINWYISNISEENKQ